MKSPLKAVLHPLDTGGDLTRPELGAAPRDLPANESLQLTERLGVEPIDYAALRIHKPESTALVPTSNMGCRRCRAGHTFELLASSGPACLNHLR